MSLATRGTGHKPWLFAALCCQLLCLKPAWVILRSGRWNPLPGGCHPRLSSLAMQPRGPGRERGRRQSRQAAGPGRCSAPLGRGGARVADRPRREGACPADVRAGDWQRRGLYRRRGGRRAALPGALRFSSRAGERAPAGVSHGGRGGGGRPAPPPRRRRGGGGGERPGPASLPPAGHRETPGQLPAGRAGRSPAGAARGGTEHGCADRRVADGDTGPRGGVGRGRRGGDPLYAGRRRRGSGAVGAATHRPRPSVGSRLVRAQRVGVGRLSSAGGGQPSPGSRGPSAFVPVATRGASTPASLLGPPSGRREGANAALGVGRARHRRPRSRARGLSPVPSPPPPRWSTFPPLA